VSTEGHNSAGEELRLLIERIERMEEEKKGIAEDIKDIYTEAKAIGFDAKILRKLIALRKQDADARREELALALSARNEQINKLQALYEDALAASTSAGSHALDAKETAQTENGIVRLEIGDAKHAIEVRPTLRPAINRVFAKVAYPEYPSFPTPRSISAPACFPPSAAARSASPPNPPATFTPRATARCGSTARTRRTPVR
jgi:uncharacterized protein (UPF0335 family)